MPSVEPVLRNSFGYVLDVPYTWSFFEFQSPLLLSYVAALNGHRAPDPRRPFTHLDLGCGNGVTSNLLAEAYPNGKFYGVDFNAEHVKNAQKIAEAGSLENVVFIESAFDALIERDLPKFDYITLHGIYSWVGADVRRHVEDCIAQMLKPGGLVYLCYKTLPGATSRKALWKMVQEHARGAKGDAVERTRSALAEITFLRRENSRFFREHPDAAGHFDKLMKRDPRYLAHEYANANYDPQYFRNVADRMTDMGCGFVGSAKLHRNNDRNTVSKRFTPHLRNTNTREERESRISFLKNEGFRWDVFQRLSKSAGTEADRLFQSLYVGAVRVPAKQDTRVRLGRRYLKLDDEVLGRLFEIAAPGQLTVKELCGHPSLVHFERAQLVSALNDLLAAKVLRPLLKPHVSEPPTADRVLRLAGRVNLALARTTLVDEGKSYFASPVSGSAHRLSFVDGMLTCLLHNNTLDALPDLFDRQAIQVGERTAYRHYRRKQAVSQDWRATKLDSFVTTCLPRLIRLGILTDA